jgi:8-oxo-dGTP pyrophosphatase MutT (NUDIX family)
MTEPAAAPAPHTDPAPPRPAASLVLLRDTSHGLEVLLLQRPAEDRVLAGAHVFPGGKVDADDSLDELLARVDASPQTLHARLGEPDLDARDAAALFVAAIRETFEETGVLLARGTSQAMSERARAMRREGQDFGQVLRALDVRLDPSVMQPWSRWVTPKVASAMRKRFDTRFFVAGLPAGQTVEHDPREAVAASLVLPRPALQRYWDRSIDFAPPQVMTLAHLSRFASVADALAHGQTRTPPTIHPFSIDTPAGRVICYPGDPQHPESARAMPGPTRLMVRDGRFLPEAGFEAWFD